MRVVVPTPPRAVRPPPPPSLGPHQRHAHTHTRGSRLIARADPADLDALRAALSAAVDAEDYGRAAQLRDELK